MVTIKSKQDIEILREGGHILARALTMLQKHVKPGVLLYDLDARAQEFLENHGGTPAFLGYGETKKTPGFPATLCASINDEVVHGVGTRKIIVKSGDVLGLDLGVRYPAEKGLFTDAAVTVGVGRISKQAEKLIERTKSTLDRAIECVRPGTTTHEISQVIQKQCEQYEYGAVRDLTGHGVGYKVHEDPPIFCYHDPKHPNTVLKEGMVICIEPMVTLGGWRVTVDDDCWTIRTADHSLAAHFEHTIVVTRDGHDIITALE
ncbi:MAG: type I methionyl aminopeptidase [bacterium]|nr:type I methionyl aminopeptidase [bacterium]